MSVELLKEILSLVGPVLASAATVVTGIAVVFRMIKKDRNKTVAERVEDNKRMVDAMEQQRKDTAVMKAKLTSMEKHITELENKIK
jgi:hypothetical protein